MPNDLLAELAQIDDIDGVKQANNDEPRARSTAWTSTPATTTSSPRTLDLGGAGGILVASHVVGDEMRRMVDEPEQRAEIDEPRCATSTRRCSSTASPMHDQGRAEPARASASGGLRLPLRRGRRGRARDDPRRCSSARGLRRSATR